MKQQQYRSSSPRDVPATHYPIPHQAAAAFTAHKSKSPQNAGLIFDRFVPDTKDSNEAKKEGLKQTREAAEKADTQLLAALNARWERDAEAIHAQPFMLKTDWRFITGLGHKGPLEAGFTFNRYGFPILPGSSVKGIARAWVFYQLAEVLKVQLENIPSVANRDAAPDDRRDLDKASPLNRLERIVSKDDDVQYHRAFMWYYGANSETFALADQFRAVFGTTSRAGNAVFVDAIPAQVPQLELDIMNPHFPKYYQGNEFPTDWQSPNPVFFLTVAPNTEFRFAVGWRGKADETLQQLAQEWLKKGLRELGAGAKTSAGYGYFVVPPTTATQKSTMVETTQAPSTSTPPTELVSTRRGTIVEIRPDKRFGRVKDSETGKEYRFDTGVIVGDTPGKTKPVAFDLQGGRVVKVRKA